MLSLRFAHYPSRCPILLELSVEATTDLGSLRSAVEDKLVTDEHCLQRVFGRWHIELLTGCGDTIMVELPEASAAKTLDSAGITDESVIYLEGPLSSDEDGLARAIALVGSQAKAAQRKQEDRDAKSEGLMRQILEGIGSLREDIQELKVWQMEHEQALRGLEDRHKTKFEAVDTRADAILTEVRSLMSSVCDLTSQTGRVEAAVADSAGKVEKVEWQGAAIHNCLVAPKQIKEIADELLSMQPNKPMQVLWEALINPNQVHIEVLMAIVTDVRCGLERIAAKPDDDFCIPNSQGVTYNDNLRRAGATPLMLAVEAGNIKFMKALLSAGASARGRGGNGQTALHIAALVWDEEKYDARIFELLLAYGADVNADSIKDGTPLCNAKLQSTIRLLVGAAADVTLVNSNNNTVLHNYLQLIFYPFNVDVCELLIDKGLNVNSVNKAGQRPLHFARSRHEVIPLLLSKGAMINAVDNFGCTALHAAAQYASLESIRTLIASGASTTIRNKLNQTALDVYLENTSKCLWQTQEIIDETITLLTVPHT